MSPSVPSGGSATVLIVDGAMPLTVVDRVRMASSLRTPNAKSGFRAMLETPTNPRCCRNTLYCAGTNGGETQCPAVRKVWQPINVPLHWKKPFLASMPTVG